MHWAYDLRRTKLNYNEVAYKLVFKSFTVLSSIEKCIFGASALPNPEKSIFLGWGVSIMDDFGFSL